MNESTSSDSLRRAMRLLLILSLAFASCAPPGPANGSQPLTSAQSIAATELPDGAPAVDTNNPPPQAPHQGPPAAPTLVRTKLSGIEIEAVAFDSRSHYLAVADQVGGPGSKWPDARAAGKAKAAIAAVNAGFFTPEGEPLGQLITMGQSRGQLNRASSLGAGFYVLDNSGEMSLLRRGRFQGGTEALQSGPLLVENGRSVSGLSDKQSSARTFVAWDGGSRWLIARSGSCSLNSLATALAGRTLGSTPLTRVLNLDGGRSSEIWASSAVANGPTYQRPFWNRPVRNFLVLKPKKH